MRVNADDILDDCLFISFFPPPPYHVTNPKLLQILKYPLCGWLQKNHSIYYNEDANCLFPSTVFLFRFTSSVFLFFVFRVFHGDAARDELLLAQIERKKV